MWYESLLVFILFKQKKSPNTKNKNIISNKNNTTPDKIIKWNNIKVIQHWVYFMVLMSWFEIISLIKLYFYYMSVETCMFACGELDVGTPVRRDTRQRSAPPSAVPTAHLLQGLCPLGSPVWSADLHLETEIREEALCIPPIEIKQRQTHVSCSAAVRVTRSWCAVWTAHS